MIHMSCQQCCIAQPWCSFQNTRGLFLCLASVSLFSWKPSCHLYKAAQFCLYIQCMDNLTFLSISLFLLSSLPHSLLVFAPFLCPSVCLSVCVLCPPLPPLLSTQGGTFIKSPCMVVGLSVKEIHYQENALLYMFTKFFKKMFFIIFMQT